jgi:hypothetical protein
MSKYQYGTKNKIIKDIMKLEKEVRFIPMHRENQETLESWSDEYLARYRWMLLELRTRNGGK